MERTETSAGAAEVDITPPVGTLLCGSLEPRPATGIRDPLLVKALVLGAGRDRFVYAVFDLAMLSREVGDRCIAAAARRTGIPRGRIVWSCTHTHTSPYTGDWFPTGSPDPTDRKWLRSLPARFAECVARADRARRPVRVSRASGFENTVSRNRRYRFKGGVEVNAWNVPHGAPPSQCLATAAAIDPEVGLLAFEDRRDRVVAALFYFALHANADFGPFFSGDYPAVVASRLRERFGPQVVTLFMPGPCGDVNPARRSREVGDALAEQVFAAFWAREPVANPAIEVVRAELPVPCRDWTVDQEARIAASGWGAASQELFRRNLEAIRASGRTSVTAPLCAWRIGEIAFAGFPGELFQGWGTVVKERSPFPWTYPVELCGDYLGYLVTRQAWDAGGYESLISTVAPVAVEGVEAMVEGALALLGDLRARRRSR